MKEINKRGGRPKKFGSLVCGGKEETPRKEKMSVVSLFNSCSPTTTCALVRDLTLLLNHSLLIKSFLFETFNNGSGN